MNIRVAELSDLAALRPCLSRKAFSTAIHQFMLSAAVTVEVDGRVLATGGLLNQGDHHELWFMAAPDLRVSRHALAVIRTLRVALHGVPASEPVHAYVVRGHDSGLRLCRIMGFRLVDCEDDGPFCHLILARAAAGLVCPAATEG
jgi:hypothetical protein